MASFKAKFPALQELFLKNHRGALCPPPPSGARVKSHMKLILESFNLDTTIDIAIIVLNISFSIVVRILFSQNFEKRKNI